jgi:hypothetical protein
MLSPGTAVTVAPIRLRVPGDPTRPRRRADSGSDSDHRDSGYGKGQPLLGYSKSLTSEPDPTYRAQL